jgi:uncharacterized repeat protein (TIGR02543 family)
MLKLKKFFSLGLVLGLVGAVGLGVMSCVEPEPDDGELYTVTLSGGGTGSSVEYYDGTKTKDFYAGDTVVIKAGVKADSYFNGWTSGSGVSFYNADTVTTTFIMPAKNVTVTANWTTVTTAQYTVTVIDGTGSGKYEEGDVVTITSNDGGVAFLSWTANSSLVEFDDEEEWTTTFEMPAANVTVKAWYPQVRFTWEAAEQSKIQSIAASEEDVQFWLETYYDAEDYVTEDATDVPLHDGSALLPNNIFSRTLHTDIPSPYKSKFLPIEVENPAGTDYTAVCTVDDPDYDNIFDIVANYKVKLDLTGDGKNYNEVAFDVAAAIADDATPWFDDLFGDSSTPPRLEKAPGKKKLAKKFVKNNVTYYVLYRARK